LDASVQEISAATANAADPNHTPARRWQFRVMKVLAIVSSRAPANVVLMLYYNIFSLARHGSYVGADLKAHGRAVPHASPKNFR
jgi:hypothetical protein